MPETMDGSASSRPRSSEPHGNCTVSMSASPSSSAGSASAAATTNSASATPRASSPGPARLDASAIEPASASIPIARTSDPQRPSPTRTAVARTEIDGHRGYAAASVSAYPTSTSKINRPFTTRIVPVSYHAPTAVLLLIILSNTDCPLT